MEQENQPQVRNPSESPFAIGDVITDAWGAVGGSKGAYWGAFGIFLLVMMGFGLVASVLGGTGESGEGGIVVALLGIAMAAVMTVFQFTLILLAIRRMRGEQIRAMMIFDGFEKLPAVVAAFFMMWVLLFIGFLLLILPGIYLSVCYFFTIPLILDKGLGPWEAMETSRKTITKKWFQYFFVILALVIITYILNLIGGLVLIGVIWTVPLTFNIFGGLYTRTFD